MLYKPYTFMDKISYLYFLLRIASEKITPKKRLINICYLLIWKDF